MNDEGEVFNNQEDTRTDISDEESIPETELHNKKFNSSTEVDESNESNEFLNHNEDTLLEPDSSASKNSSTSIETIEETNADSTVESSNFISSLMRDIINERIMELLDLPDVANFIRSKSETIVRPDSSSKD